MNNEIQKLLVQNTIRMAQLVEFCQQNRTAQWFYTSSPESIVQEFTLYHREKPPINPRAEYPLTPDECFKKPETRRMKTILEELRGYDPCNQTGTKALRVYVKCLRRRKVELADKILKKYGKQFPKPDDRVIAFTLAIISSEPKNKS